MKVKSVYISPSKNSTFGCNLLAPFYERIGTLDLVCAQELTIAEWL